MTSAMAHSTKHHPVKAIEYMKTARIGYLIPEFPGQTHAFFMRELRELHKRGVQTLLLSTRPPTAAARAKHDWAETAAADTTYLTPIKLSQLPVAAMQLLKSGPAAWVRCLQAVFSADGLTLRQRAQVAALIPVAAWLVTQLTKGQCQHLHIHSCANSAWLGVFVSLLSNISYSLTLHGPLHDYGSGQPTKWHHAKFVIVITKDLIREAREKIPHTLLPPLILAPMGVNIDAFQRSAPYAAPCPDTPVRLVSCGRINPCKGHDDLIKAVAMLRAEGFDVSLKICGSIDSQRKDYEQSLYDLIQAHQLHSCVHILGSVAEQRVRDELQDAHIFCLASHKEPLGVATMEAMSMQMPVIVTESPGVCEMITDGHDGLLVSAKSPDEFVKAIRGLIADSDQCRRLAINARLTIEQGFHSGVSAEAIRDGISLKNESTDQHRPGACSDVACQVDVPGQLVS